MASALCRAQSSRKTGFHFSGSCSNSVSAWSRSQHVADVGGPRRVSKYRRLQILGRQTVTDRDTKQVDDLFGMGPDEVSAQDAIGALLDQCLETVDRFIEPQGGVPVRNFLRMHSEFEPLRARLRLAKADSGNRGNRERDARDAPVI